MSKESAQDKELLERYRRASDTEAAAPSEAVRAAILAEGRRAAEQRAKEVPGQLFRASRPAANDSRWKMTAFGTAGAALVAALLFAPRLWESAPPPPSVSNTAPSPTLESLHVAPNASEPLQEIVVTQATRESSTSAGAASAKSSAPAARAGRAPSADEIAAPKATEVKPRMDLPAPERQEALAQSAAPAEKIYPQNYGSAAPPTFPTAPDPQISRLAPAPNAASVASSRSAPQPAALQSAAASGDTAQTTVLLNQGAALDARDDHGRTPLMLAVMQGRLDVVRLLLDRGADPTIADGAGRTPLQQAKQQNLREIAALLERAGAR
jgi:ankyrin repeat protein